MKIIFIGLIIAGSILIAVFREHKRRQNRCSKCGSKRTKKVPQMHPIKFVETAITFQEQAWRKRIAKEGRSRWRCYGFRECSDCGYPWLAKIEEKFFTTVQIERRKRKEPESLDCGPKLERLIWSTWTELPENVQERFPMVMAQKKKPFTVRSSSNNSQP
jgi:hypothetical protein